MNKFIRLKMFIGLTLLTLSVCNGQSISSKTDYVCSTNDPMYSAGFKRSLSISINEDSLKKSKFPDEKSNEMRFSVYELPITCGRSGNTVTFAETSCDANDAMKIQFDRVSGVLLYMRSDSLVIWNCIKPL